MRVGEIVQGIEDPDIVNITKNRDGSKFEITTVHFRYQNRDGSIRN